MFQSTAERIENSSGFPSSAALSVQQTLDELAPFWWTLLDTLERK